MKQKPFYITTSILLFLLSTLQAQDSSLFTPRLILDFPVLELPHLSKAAGMAYNKRLDKTAGNTTAPNVGDYFRSYENLSMQQALSITKNLHATNYYFNNKVWNKWIAPTNNKKALLNRIAANASSGAVDYVLAYHLMVFGPVWLHEEFHRNGITHQCISSHNDTYYRFGGGTAGGSISKVKDEDLVRFKATAPQEMIRTFAAGAEAQYELVRSMNKDNFFSKTNYANVVMNILVTKQAVDYVNQFKKKDYDASIDSMNNFDGTKIASRDFVGWDFTAWVYDLFKPAEAYTNRGTHPSGVGVDRAIKRSKLSQAEDDYLGKMGRMQYINFLSPSMIGISRIKLNEHSSFSFAGRHILNSFGYDLGADVYLDIKGRQWLIGLHGYQNHDRFFPGIEIENPGLQVKTRRKSISLQARAMLWLQPKDQLFKTTKAAAGGLLQLRSKYPMNKTFLLFAELEGKTDGWVAGNPYLKSNLTLRTGFTLDIHHSSNKYSKK